MIIYRAYLDYGPYEGESTLGYFESIAGAYNAIQNSSKDYGFELKDSYVNDWQDTVFKVISEPGYNYVIQTIEVKP